MSQIDKSAKSQGSTGDVLTIETRAPNEAEQSLKEEMNQTLTSLRTVLMHLQPFTASLAMRLNMRCVVDDRLPTAATDGETVFFNAKFLQSLSQEDKRFLLAHEVWHSVLGHFRRQGTRNTRLWNAAADYEINQLLFEEFGYYIEGCLYDEKFEELSAESIYGILQRQQAAQPEMGSAAEQGNNGSKDKEGTGNNGLEPLDEHNIWDALARDGVVIDPDFTPRTQPTKEQDRQEQSTWRERLVATAQQQNKWGNMSSSLKRLVGQLSEPKVPWEHLLERFLRVNLGGGERHWLPPARRYVHQGLYLQSRKSKELNIKLALDCSYSCFEYLDDFVSELKGILGAYERVSLEVLPFDVKLQESIKLTENDLYKLAKLELAAGGGTDFHPIFEALEGEIVDALVILTDGYAQAPEERPPYPVLWALTPGGKKPTPWGEGFEMEVG